MKNVTVDLMSDFCWEEEQIDASLAVRGQRSLDLGRYAATGAFQVNLLENLVLERRWQSRQADGC